MTIVVNYPIILGKINIYLFSPSSLHQIQYQAARVKFRSCVGRSIDARSLKKTFEVTIEYTIKTATLIYLSLRITQLLGTQECHQEFHHHPAIRKRSLKNQLSSTEINLYKYETTFSIR